METMKNLLFCRRPDEISGPLSKNEEALIHALHWMKERDGVDYEVVINLQPTSPCRTNNLLDACIEAYSEGGYDSLLTATKDTPFLWQLINGKWEYTVDKNNCCDRKMRQEFKEEEFVYHDNGNIYLVESNILLDRNCRIGYNPCVYETSGIDTVQIDEEFDFLFSQLKLEYQAVTLAINCLSRFSSSRSVSSITANPGYRIHIALAKTPLLLSVTC